MKLRKLIFPLAVIGSFCVAVAAEMAAGPVALGPYDPAPKAATAVASAPAAAATPAVAPAASPDTVIYPVAGYKARRKGHFEKVEIADSLLGGPDTLAFEEEIVDTLPHLTARDTIKAPDSLRELDPWRYKYYVALLDSLTHKEVADSLQHEGDSLMTAFHIGRDTLSALEDSILRESAYQLARQDSTMAEFNFSERHKLDSTYYADSTARAKAAFEAWYNSLSKEERKKYDFEQKELRKKAIRDSLDRIKDREQAIRDSIRDNTPRILDTYAIPDSMHFKRIIAWTEDRDFGQLKPFVPDTGYNYHFYDYKFLREDVNASWLGVAGSPVQNYNYFTRKSNGVSFSDPYEAWTFRPETFIQYNTKTPHTELAYYGTLMAGEDKESDNIHIFTTQNITPELNFNLLYDSWGGGGMLINEKVKNKTAAAGLNYLGKRYTANAGLIHNKVEMGENGGLTDIAEIRDTTIELREVKVAMEQAKSTTKKLTLYGDQQLRIPFNFINDWKARRDSTFVPDSTADITTAFIGHAIEYSRFQREFVNGNESDSLGQTRLDNKVYLRLQPWSADALISKLDVGIGDYLHSYHNVLAADTTRLWENSLYTYAGASGQFTDHSRWDAKAHLVFAGADAGNMDISAGLGMEFYPFRRARKSPVAINVRFGESLVGPTFYQRHMYSTVNELMRWDNSFDKTSVTKIEGSLKIPYWKLEAKAGYALIGNQVYYDTLGVVRQHSDGVISVMSGYLRKEFVIANFLHLDNKILAQFSSNTEVLPLPNLALNLRWFVQFPVQKVMDMQIGVNAWWNTKWYAPEWNYLTGTFKNQNEWAYNNGPYFDAFINIRWKQVTMFIKLQNAGAGWPMDHADYFSTHRHIITGNGGTGLKLGIWWPFYLSPTQNKKVDR